MDNKEIKIERLSSSNFHLFQALFFKVFDKKKSSVDLIKKYNNPGLSSQKAYFGFMAIDQGFAVSYSGSIIYPFEVDGNKFLAAHSCDHMTLKQYRGRGLFQQLNLLEENLLRELNIPLIFGFPNQNNAPILIKKSKWQHLNSMYAFEIKVKTIPWLKLKEKLLIFKTHKINLPSTQSLKKDYIIGNWNGMRRDRSVFENKDNEHKYVLESNNGITWLKLGPTIFIGDFQIEAKGTLADLIEDWIELAKRNGAHKIVFLCSENYPYYNSYKKLSPPIKANLVAGKVLNDNFNVDLSAMAFSYMDYDTF